MMYLFQTIQYINLFISDNPIHHQEQGDGDREQGAGRHQSGQDPGRQHRRLEVGATLRASAPADQSQGLSSYQDTI